MVELGGKYARRGSGMSQYLSLSHTRARAHTHIHTHELELGGKYAWRGVV